MTPDRKHSAAGFWLTVAMVAVLAGYPLSYGPFVWLDNHVSMPAWLHDDIDVFFRPLLRFCINHPAPFGELLDWYANLWRFSI